MPELKFLMTAVDNVSKYVDRIRDSLLRTGAAARTTGAEIDRAMSFKVSGPAGKEASAANYQSLLNQSLNQGLPTDQLNAYVQKLQQLGYVVTQVGTAEEASVTRRVAKYRELQAQVDAYRAKRATPEGVTEEEKSTYDRAMNQRWYQKSKMTPEELAVIKQDAEAAKGAMASVGDGAEVSAKKTKLLTDRVAELKAKMTEIKIRRDQGTPLTEEDLEAYTNAKMKLADLESQMKGMGSGVTSLSEGFFFMRMALMSVAFAFTLVRMAMSTLKFIEEGAKLEGIATAYESMASSLNINSQKLLEDLRAVSYGALDAAALMTSANRAMMSGGSKFAEDLPRLFEVARSASIATGQDIQYVYTSLIKGIAKGSPLLIDNAEIYMRLGDAMEVYARSLNKTVQDLSPFQRSEAIKNAILLQGEKLIRMVGSESQTASEKIASFGVGWKDMTSEIGREIGVPDWLGGIGRAMERFAINRRTVADFNKTLKEFADTTDDLRGKTMAGGEFWGPVPAVPPDITPQMDQYEREIAKFSQRAFDAYVRYTNDVGRGVSQDVASKTFQRTISEIQAEMVKYTESYRKIVGLPPLHPKVENSELSEGIRLIQLFNQEYDKALGSRMGVEDRTKQLATMAAQMTALSKQSFEMPGLPTNLAEFDPGPYLDYLRTSAGLLPQISVDWYAIEMAILAAKNRQDEILQGARQGFPTYADRFAFIAKGMYGVSGTLDMLLDNFDKFPAGVQKQLRELGIYQAAIEEFQRKASQPIDPKSATASYQHAVDQITQMLERLDRAGVGEGIASSLRDRLAAELPTIWSKMTSMKPTDAEAYLRGVIEGWQDLTDKEKAALDLANTYSDALSKMKDQATLLQNGIPEQPQLGGTIAEVDTGPIQRWIDALREKGLITQKDYDTTILWLNGLDQAQAALIRTIQPTDDAIAGISRLMEVMGTATFDEFIQQFDNLNPAVQAAVGKLDVFGMAIDNLRTKTEAPISIKAQVDMADEAASAADQIALRLLKTGTINIEQAKKFRDQIRAGAWETARAQLGADEWYVKAALQVYTSYYDEYVSKVESALKKTEEEHKKTWQDIMSGIQTRIDLVFSASTEVTQTDMLATATGEYKDKAMESVRQLQDIMEHGREALTRHPDWIAKFEIPWELAKGLDPEQEKQLKLWAGRLQDRVKALARPDLIDWGAFVENYRQQLEDEGSKEATIKIAISKLEAAGLLTGKTEEEKRKEVLKAFGVEDFDVEAKFKAMFKTDENAAAGLVSQVLGGKPSLEMPVHPKWVPGPEEAPSEYRPGSEYEARLESGKTNPTEGQQAWQTAGLQMQQAMVPGWVIAGQSLGQSAAESFLSRVALQPGWGNPVMPPTVTTPAPQGAAPQIQSGQSGPTIVGSPQVTVTIAPGGIVVGGGTDQDMKFGLAVQNGIAQLLTTLMAAEATRPDFARSHQPGNPVNGV